MRRVLFTISVFVALAAALILPSSARATPGAGQLPSGANVAARMLQDTATQAPAPIATNTPFLPFFPPSTPQPDGKVEHVVVEGQSLWMIAISYQTTINEIALLNDIALDNPVVWIGQILVVRPANTALPTATISLTPEPSQTAPPSQTPPPVTQTPLTIATAEPSGGVPVSGNSQGNRGLFIAGLSLVGGGLLLALIFGALWGGRRRI